MPDILVILFIIQFMVLLCLYTTDRRIQFMSKSGIKQVELLALQKYKRFFVYYRRKDGLITKHAFVCMIAYYIINFAWFIIVLIQIITGNASYLATICGIFILANLVLLFPVFLQPALTFEQTLLLREYEYKEQARKEKEKKGRRSAK